MQRLTTQLNRLSPRVTMMLSFAGTSVLNYLFGIAIVWLLTPGDNGLVAFSQTIILITSLILNSGFAWSITAQVASTTSAEREAIIRGSFVANLLLSLALSALIAGFFAAGTLEEGLETWAVTLVVVLTLPFLSLIAIANGVVRGAERFGSLAFVKILEVAVKAAAGILLALMGYGAGGALAGFLVGSIIAAVVGVWQVISIFKMNIFGPFIFPSMRMAGDLFGALLGMALLLNIDIILVKMFTVRETAGYYQSAIMLANTPYYMATALFSVLFPQLARTKDITKSLPFVADTLRWIVLILIPIELGLIIAPHQVLDVIFPDRYLVAAPILRVLAIGNTGLILAALMSTTFQATNKALTVAIVVIGVVICEALTQLIVVPVYGAVGAASVFSAACFAAFIILGIIYLRSVTITLNYKWVAQYLIALSLTFACYFALSLFMPFLVSAILASLCYLVLTVWFGILPVPQRLNRFLHPAR